MIQFDINPSLSEILQNNPIQFDTVYSDIFWSDNKHSYAMNYDAILFDTI